MLNAVAAVVPLTLRTATILALTVLAATVLAIPFVAAAAASDDTSVVEKRANSGGNSVRGAMVHIPGGTFRPRYEAVKVEPFLLDVTAVTVAAYEECVKAGKCSDPGVGGYCNWGKAERANHPINCVDWNQATTYCLWAGKRLPTDDERLWAVRGGRAGTPYPWGTREPSDQLCWNGGSVEREKQQLGTCEVGSFPSGTSPHGAKDLAGNVWEWTSKTWASSNQRMRGGSWRDDGSGDAGYVGTFGRFSVAGIAPTVRVDYLGFRCARREK